jgi:hypothetical protein
MPAYQQIVAFMADVRRANPTFEHWVKSDLRPLINVLEDNNGNAVQVQHALRELSTAKVAKYRDAIWYLQATYPGLVPQTLPMGALEKTNAAKYTRTVLMPNYDPSIIPPRRNRPDSIWLNQTIEQWLLTTPGTKGILLIHLSNFQQPMNQVYSGRRVVDHMNSVLRIGRLCGCDLLCLYMQGNPVCNELADAANAFEARKTDLRVHPQHMGGRSEVYRNFANQHNNVVVMGFDADVCVNANLFGSPERIPDQSFVKLLTSMTNVVTSRGVLVMTGVIYPAGNQGEYGVLNEQ